MKSVIKEAKTVDDAVTDALIELGASTDKVDIEVISKGSRGLFGLGAKKAKVKVTLKEEPEDFNINTEIPDDLLGIKEEIQSLTREAEDEDKPLKGMPEEKQQHDSKSIGTPIKAVTETTEIIDNNLETKQEVEQAINKEIIEKNDDIIEDYTAIPDSEDLVVVTQEELDKVIANATDFINKLFAEMDIKCDVKTEVVNNNRISMCLEGENMGIIIGKRGETLDAIQYLVNIVANKGRKQYIKIMIDTENYRARREETLKNLAIKLSKKVQKTNRAVVLEPMNPYDRRIIHSTLQNSKYVKTHSEGKEPYRKVVITPSYHRQTTTTSKR